MSRSHNHNNCPTAYGECVSGVLTSYCDDDNCHNEYCMELGHCPCECHSGKTCDCGYQWERMQKNGTAA
jgi:hypothetical protein